MAQGWQCRQMVLLNFVMTFLAGGNPALAQIVPDSTLPNPSVVRQEDRVHTITGGTRAGANLFHSFREFSVPRGGTASFREIDAGIANIFSRVTGSSISRINGLIETLQSDRTLSSANLFLLNPNGIIFGQNAALNIGGSFLATTAESIQFGDRTEFSTTAPTAALLTISVPVGLQFGDAPVAIINRSTTPLLDQQGNPIRAQSLNTPITGLRVLPGHTLSLVGGDVLLQGGGLNAYGGEITGGRIDLGSLASAGEVRLIADDQGWILDYDSRQALGKIQLSQSTIIADGSGGGEIRLRANNISLTDFSLILADTSGEQAGRGISLDASQITLANQALISASTTGSGRGGDISITSDRLFLENIAQIETNTLASGQGGNLLIAADLIELDSHPGDQFPSGLFARVAAGATGAGGNIDISTETLRIRSGSVVDITTLGLGAAGSMTVQATDIELMGVALSATGEPILIRGVPSPSALSAFSFPKGQSGDISITTERLTLRDGAVIQTSTQGEGDAGNVQIRATEFMQITGLAPDGRTPTGILTFSGGIPTTATEGIGNPNATGRAGNLSIDTGTLIVRDGAVIAGGSLNPSLDRDRSGGGFTIQADDIELTNRGSLLTATAASTGGNMRLRIADTLLLRQNSQISTTAGIANASGDGGNIWIRSDRLLAEPTGNSDITANAFTGRGGNVRIVADQIFGIAAREQLTPFSDITASSELGVPGEIVITSPEVEDPNRGLVALPTGVIDVSQQITQRCPLNVDQEGEVEDVFTVVGRGGLPINPNGLLERVEGVEEWVERGREGDGERGREGDGRATEGAIAEAQGWVVNGEGAIELVAHYPVVVSPLAEASSCEGDRRVAGAN